MLLFGIAMILMMLFRPQGILGNPHLARNIKLKLKKARV
jgi:ABC-type branched-subunit amino acid transport system permease subunit